jgi:hypothetical protein
VTLSALELRRLIGAGQVSPVELLEACIARNGQHPMGLLAALGPDVSAGLLSLLRAVAESGQHSTLQAALADPKVQALVVVLQLGEPPVATLAASLAAPDASDALGQWLDLSCI